VAGTPVASTQLRDPSKINDQGVGVHGGPTTAACARVVIGYLSCINPTVPSPDSPAPGGHL
jgi:hypothetical protein